ncbi:MAG: acetylornithine/succinylornithine family transaminase [Ignavibacteria bacterium]|nr:acetylornithine/succinylornithine family transaminase [Ignavibacteria bacterium]
MVNYIEIEQSKFLQTYKRFPIVIENAKGSRIYDKFGTEYLDFLSGIAVNVVGHSHSKVISAIEKQISRYMHISNYFYQDIQIEYASKFLEIAGYDRLFYTNSGTEAIEGALKIVRRWGNLRNKRKIISFSGGFHGRTYGSLSLMDKPHYKELMGPFLDNISIINFNDINALNNSIDSETAGVFIEFIQGEGGLQKVSKEFVEMLWELKSKYNFLIVADEIQSGMFRTGKLFAFEHYFVKPDIVTVAKGFGGGLPLGAILVQSNLQHIFEKGMHGTTFGGNPVSCAAGLATLEIIYPDLIPHILEVSRYLWEKLELIKNEFPSYVKEVRGKGLMCGLLLTFDAIILVEKLLEERIITNATSKNVLRIVPPLIINNEDVDLFYNGLKNALSKI